VSSRTGLEAVVKRKIPSPVPFSYAGSTCVVVCSSYVSQLLAVIYHSFEHLNSGFFITPKTVIERFSVGSKETPDFL